VTTHYDVLGVTGDAGAEEIKRAYYDRARLYHPDAHVASPEAMRLEAERAMQALNVAWTVLRVAASRRRYDRELAAEEGEPARDGRRAGGSRARALQLGSGFQYWMGSTSGLLRSDGGAPRLNIQVTGDTLEPLRVLAPDGLAALHAEESAIGDGELLHLQGMRGLRYLDLSGTRITDAGLVHLLGCTGLETLMLWDTAIGDAGLSLLGRLRNLCQLGLGNTTVSDAGLAHLRPLRRLRLLQLWGTEVAGPGLRHLHDLVDLEVVSLPWRVRGIHRRRLRTALPRASIVA
jgi:hypothetical protein